MQEGSRRAIVAALIANLGIAVAKIAAAIITGSASMIAESIHSLADTGNQGLLFLGGRKARRPADANHQFGHGAERYFWAFVVALVLFSLGSLFSLYEGVQKLRAPHAVESPVVAFVVLGIAIVLESLSLRTAIGEAAEHRSDGWRAFIRNTKSPELPVVLLEDTGALAGLALALIGLTLAVVTDEPRFDALGSLAIGVLLAVIAVVLAIEMKSLLIGESASVEEQDLLLSILTESPEVHSVIHLRTLHLGPEELLVAAKLDFVASETEQLAAAIDAVEARVRAAVPTANLIYLESDLDRTSQ